MFIYKLLVIIILVTGDILLSPVFCQNHDAKLLNYLFHAKGYNPLIRPVRNASDTLTVRMELALIQIINVDEKNQYLTTNVWIRMSWNDYQLQWDPNDFGGISVLRVPPKKVWTPDVVLFNNADGNYEVAWQPNILVEHNGDILWIPPAIYKSSCTILVEFFPFDEQKCEMKFGSWTFDSSQVTLGWHSKKYYVDLSDYFKSGTWDIIDCYGKISRTVKLDSSEAVHIVYTLTLRRKTLYYTVNLIIPCVLIAFLSVCLFYLPTDSCEKIQVCVTLQLALVVFLLLISKILPNTSLAIPLISRYLLFTFILNIIIFFVTLVVVRAHYSNPNTNRMPEWMRTIFMERLPPFLLMRRQNHVLLEMKERRKANSRSESNANNLITGRQEIVEKFLLSPSPTLPSQRHVEENESKEGCSSDRPSSDLAGVASSSTVSSLTHQPTGNNQAGFTSPHLTQRLPAWVFSQDVSDSAEAIRYILTHLRNADEFDLVRQDWKYVAYVIDRLLLFVFIVVTLGGSVGIFLQAPNYQATPSQEDIIKFFSQDPPPSSP